jgi:hypothetical protein
VESTQSPQGQVGDCKVQHNWSACLYCSIPSGVVGYMKERLITCLVSSSLLGQGLMGVTGAMGGQSNMEDGHVMPGVMKGVLFRVSGGGSEPVVGG